MCQTSIGRVVTVEDGQAVVDLDGGVRRRAISLMVPDLAVGDLVLVGLGTVLGRVDPADQDAFDMINLPLAGSPAAVPLDRPTH
jgi:hydrogenase maturation factor